ncbi:MAG TPA: DUF1295 domain-containing protein [Gordonia polyisoprenivorans]|uniref:DUF1295 domain-containing protein n=1 Tax=Gordonia polyisoprenivorans TaxID=84595 RepID=UPI0003800EEA|nr:DUF1295 domain-containing protein [Gordonia polyisoprenivorans]QUD83085.1 DUF1295 domain-containing protein [Gordonia polyisoprenivorans]HCS57006.1 DUF1295 domain-containing protein [Gordonia polyisoprenivorans]
MTRSAGFLRIGIAYTLAIAVGLVWLLWGPHVSMPWLDALIADVLATLVIFIFSRAHHNSSFYDAYWSVIPPLLVVWWWVDGDAGIGAVHCWLLTALVVSWSIRLTVNWAKGFPGLHHEDWRYPMLRDQAGRGEIVVDLTAIHLIPTLQVFLALMPAYIAVRQPDTEVLWLTGVALVVGVAALGLETVADRQLHAFVATASPGAVMDRGVWSWSRHPNYFGEFGFWLSLALFGVAAAPSDAWWMFVGAVVMLAMFLGASIPMMERRSLDRRPDYASVIGRVSKFVPWPPRPTVQTDPA